MSPWIRAVFETINRVPEIWIPLHGRHKSILKKWQSSLWHCNSNYRERNGSRLTRSRMTVRVWWSLQLILLLIWSFEGGNCDVVRREHGRHLAQRSDQSLSGGSYPLSVQDVFQVTDEGWIEATMLSVLISDPAQLDAIQFPGNGTFWTNLTGVQGTPYLIESQPGDTRYGALAKASERIMDLEKDDISALGPQLIPRASRLINAIYGMSGSALPQNCSLVVGATNPYAFARGLPTIAWNGNRVLTVLSDTNSDYVPARLIDTTQNVQPLVPVNLPVGLSWIDPFTHAQTTSSWSDWITSDSACQGLAWQGNSQG